MKQILQNGKRVGKIVLSLLIQKVFRFSALGGHNISSSRNDFEVEPGMAFGTGQHATTQLCLMLRLRRYLVLEPHSVLDVGTGTGILAIADKKIGCTSLIATDIDADAVIAARENASRNAVDFEVLQEVFLRMWSRLSLSCCQIFFL